MQTLPEIIKHVRDNSPDPEKCMISFSGGKDAWCCWLALREHFDTTCYAYYLVPGLEHVDEYLDQCEKKVGKIHRYPSPHLYNRLNDCIYQPPERLPILAATGGLPKFDFDVVSRCCEISAGLPEKTWTAIGVRAADSIARAGAIKTHGAWSDKRRIFYPVWDWKKDRLMDELRRNNIRLSKEYCIYGRTFDGLFLLYALGLKEHYPRDYQRVLEFFPFVELEVFRYEKGLLKYGDDASLPKNVSMPESQPQSKFGFSFLKQRKDPKDHKYSKLNQENKKVAEKMQSMVDPEFWLSVYFPDKSRFQIVFEDRNQKEYLLKHLKLSPHGDKYIDGLELAKKINLQSSTLPRKTMFKLGGKNKLKNPLEKTKYNNEPEHDCYAELEVLKNAMPSVVEFLKSHAETFLKDSAWIGLSESGNLYCHDVADALGIQLPATNYYYRPRHKPDAKLESLV